MKKLLGAVWTIALDVALVQLRINYCLLENGSVASRRRLGVVFVLVRSFSRPYCLVVCCWMCCYSRDDGVVGRADYSNLLLLNAVCGIPFRVVFRHDESDHVAREVVVVCIVSICRRCLLFISGACWYSSLGIEKLGRVVFVVFEHRVVISLNPRRASVYWYQATRFADYFRYVVDSRLELVFSIIFVISFKFGMLSTSCHHSSCSVKILIDVVLMFAVEIVRFLWRRHRRSWYG